jgi:flavin reductase (DIM6/NTAB) family NADH-FMN oxidoreductase RutF
MPYFTKDELAALPDLYRRNLMNTLLGFKNGNLVATKDSQGLTNVAIFNSMVHLGATPPHIAFVMRPTTVERHTYDNIIETGFYTINHVKTSFVKQAHQTAAKYSKTESEFEFCGFTEEYSEKMFAPYVKESEIKMGMKFVEEIHIKTNNVILMIGEVQEIFLNGDFVRPDGFIDLVKAQTAVISGLDAYYEALELARFSYPRPQQSPTEIF